MRRTIDTAEELRAAIAALGGYCAYYDEEGDLAHAVAQVFRTDAGGLYLFSPSYLDPYCAGPMGRHSPGPATLADNGEITFARGRLARAAGTAVQDAIDWYIQELKDQGCEERLDHARLAAAHGGEINGEAIT